MKLSGAPPGDRLKTTDTLRLVAGPQDASSITYRFGSTNGVMMRNGRHVKTTGRTSGVRYYRTDANAGNRMSSAAAYRSLITGNGRYLSASFASGDITGPRTLAPSGDNRSSQRLRSPFRAKQRALSRGAL